MSRDTAEVLKSGYLTEAEAYAIKVELYLEDREEEMGEGAAQGVTAEHFDMEFYEVHEVLIDLPDGEWWKAENLPVKETV